MKYFLTLSYNECLIRRRSRNRFPPEPAGYFERIAWPMYMENLEKVNRTPLANTIKYLDGSDSLENNFNTILRDLKEYLAKTKFE